MDPAVHKGHVDQNNESRGTNEILVFSTKPMQAFGPFGLTCGFVGLTINMYLAFLWSTGEAIGHRPLLMLGVLLVIVGNSQIAVG